MKIALAVVIATALASMECAPKCNAACSNSVTGTGTTSGDVSKATDTTLCIGNECSIAMPITFDASGDALATYTGPITGTLKMTPAGDITLVVTAKTNGFNDGDVYGLLVNQGAAGTLVAKTSAPITYTRVDLCGNTCEQASFSF
jgi:hypothetical protein